MSTGKLRRRPRKLTLESGQPGTRRQKRPKKAAWEEERKTRKDIIDQNPPDRSQIAVTEIIDGANFCYQIIVEETRALSDLMNLFQATDWSNLPPHEAKQREVVSAQFSHDGNWYRAEIKNVIDIDGSKSYDVVYIDYGNGETVGLEKVRKLGQEFNEKVLPRQAKIGRLAYIVPPKADDEFSKDSAALFKQLVWGRTLNATCYTDYKTKEETLVIGDPETNITINGALVSAGLARTEKRRYNNDFFRTLKEEEDKARKDRLNIWQYGDLPDSDDERSLLR